MIDLPLRASNDGFLKWRVARAQEIIRLHPLLCSVIKRRARLPNLPFPSFPQSKIESGRTGGYVGSTAAVERAHSHCARSGSKEPT